MRKARGICGKNAGQEGYALVLVVFMLALAVIGLATVTPNVLVSGRREKEEEMIWRGRQYVRGIRLFVRYYQMHGGQTKFPTSMDDLTKNKVGIRFMRQEYKEPMNHVDGSWRFIYVGPNGQLIGSLKPQQINANAPPGFSSQTVVAGATGAVGTSSSFGNSSFGNSSFGNSSGGNSSFGGSSFGGSSFGGSSSGNSSFGNSSFGNSSFGNSSFNNSGQPAQTTATSSQSGSVGAQSGTDPQNGSSSWGDMSTPQALADADVNLTIVGGNIIGVGSKVNQKSIIWYDKAKNYRQFEFVWDPAKEPVNGGANASVVGIGPQAPLNGATPVSGSPGTGTNPAQQGNVVCSDQCNQGNP